MYPVTLLQLGVHNVGNPAQHEPGFLSAASGIVWRPRCGTMWSVGDDQNNLVEYSLSWAQVQAALYNTTDCTLLRPGRAQRILPGVLPVDENKRKNEKPDFEAMTIITHEDIEAIPDSQIRNMVLARFQYGLLLIVGSGGFSYSNIRRSIGVVFALQENGNISGMAGQVSFEKLHTYLDERHVIGKLNIEGISVHGAELILAQRGNSLGPDNNPAPNMLIRLSLADVLYSMLTDGEIGECELLDQPATYQLGSLPHGERHIKLDFTDIDAVHEDPKERLVFTAAAEAEDGVIAGSVIGVMNRHRAVTTVWHVRQKVKLEGVDARFNHTNQAIDLLAVPDADDPNVAAQLYAARLHVA